MSLSYVKTAMCPSTFLILPVLNGPSFTQNEITVPQNSAQGYTNTEQQVTLVHTYIPIHFQSPIILS